MGKEEEAALAAEVEKSGNEDDKTNESGTVSWLFRLDGDGFALVLLVTVDGIDDGTNDGPDDVTGIIGEEGVAVFVLRSRSPDGSIFGVGGRR